MKSHNEPSVNSLSTAAVFVLSSDESQESISSLVFGKKRPIVNDAVVFNNSILLRSLVSGCFAVTCRMNGCEPR